MADIFQNNDLATEAEVDFCTREEAVARYQAILKSKRDIAWWAEHFFRIIPASGGLQTIKLYQKQKELLYQLVSENRNIVLASRQVGKTTCYTVFCMWLATLFSEKKIMICANKLQTAIEIMDRLRLAYDYLPKWLKPKKAVYNKGEITFSNKSSIRAFATSSSASRGFSGSVVIIDEMAFIPKNIIDEFFASVMPVISSAKNSKAIIVSTPNGASGLYYEIWQQANSTDASKNVEGWKPFRIDWWEVPNRDEKWKQQQIATVGMDKWLQEFCNEFAAGSSTQKLIPDDIIEKFRRRTAELRTTGEIKGKIQKITSETNQRVYDFTMWHEFKQGHAYLAAVDVAEGTGGDSSVLYVFDITDIRKITMCAKFASPTVSTIEFAFITARILKLYNNPWLICESNGVGSGYLDSLRITYGYENIVREGKDNKYGITSHVQVKGKACLWLREMFTTNGVAWELYDPDLVEEMGHFIKKDSKVHLVYNAAMGAHDDHIMALCWAAWMLNPEVVQKYYIVVTSFKTDLEKFLPKQIAPLQEPTVQELTEINNDPLYVEYMDFKKQLMQTLQTAAQNERTVLARRSNKPTFEQLFFGEQIAQEAEWGSPWTPQVQSLPTDNAQLMMNARKPQFIINNGFW